MRALEIPNETRHLAAVRAFVADVLRAAPVAQAVRNEVVLAVDEAVSNSIEHAYGAERRGPITVEVALTDGEVKVTVTDRGRRFDGVVAAPSVDIEEHVRLGRQKGLGLYLIHKIMDEVRYERDGEKNALTLVKRLSGLPQPGASGERGCPGSS